MKYFRNILNAVIVLSVLAFSAAHAVTVNFTNEYAGVTVLQNNFIDADPTDGLENSSSVTFVDGAVEFSGGVALRAPLDSTGLVGNIITGGVDAGAETSSVYYGTAYSPTTSIMNPGLTDPIITIDIDASENFTSISGELVNGLNTNAPQNQNRNKDINEDGLVDGDGLDPLLASYTINFFTGSDGSVPLDTVMTGDVPFTDGATTIPFSFESAMMQAITKVQIVANDLDLNGLDEIVENEWDFLLASVSFENTSPIPVPAALPLFISALLGGYVIARPRRSS